MRNPLGYKVLRTYQQGEEIYQLAKAFTASHLHTIKDSRLIGHINDSARSVPRNISEGYGRGNTKQYYEFLGFSFGSLLELLEDCLSLEKDIKDGVRIVTDINGALRELDVLIKLCMGEKTMLKSQMEKMEQMVGEQGLISPQLKVARAMQHNHELDMQFSRWVKDLNKQLNPKVDK
jgi:four helix bundle protein